MLNSFELFKPPPDPAHLSPLLDHHAHGVFPVFCATVAKGVSGETRVVWDMVALATAQAEVHVADAPPELGVSRAMTSLSLL